MKRFLSTVAALAFIVAWAYAIPAKPGFRSYAQPDGKTLVLEQKGDEFGSWFTDKSGNKFVMDSDGYFRPVSEARVRTISRNASQMRLARSNYLRTGEYSDMTHGTRHIPVILVEFSDVKFRIDSPGQSFNDLLNQNGYNGYQGTGATGSVRDFYLDNSHGVFDPVFDVYGPVTLENPIKYYGEQTKKKDGTVDKEDKQPELALYDACLKLDQDIDFSLYDYNSDGFVDMTLFYFAGGSQAEGWPVDNLWPHSWNVQASSNADARNHTFDGKKLANYFCSSELKGVNLSATMCSIGVTCHEFAHSLGLPDFYDADYEQNGSNAGLYSFSTMCIGSYNDNSRTPPYFNAEERIMLGWMDESEIEPVSEGENTLPFIDGNVALRTEASAEGEYFLYEKRGGKGNKWDAPLPEGMVVYHVDKSPSHTVGGRTAQYIWNTNSINNYGGHPCFAVVPAPAQGETNYASTKVDNSDLVFPGFHGIDSYCAVDWDGNNSSFLLTDIRVSGDDVLFNAIKDTGSRFLEGKVTDTSGNPLEGVTISLNPYEDAMPAGSRVVLRKLLSAGKQDVVTDQSGRFSMEIAPEDPDDYSISAGLEGFVGQTTTIRLSRKFSTIDFSLRAVGEFGMTMDFPFGDFSSNLYGLRNSDFDSSLMVSSLCTRNVWGAYEGLLVKDVTFLTYFDAEAYYFIIDSEENGISAAKSPKKSKEGYVTFDMSDEDIHIPSGDFYIGFAAEKVKPNDLECVMALFSGLGVYISPFTLSGNGSWSYTAGYGLPLRITLFDQDYVPRLPDIGQPYIDIAPGLYRAGDKVTLKLATSPDMKIRSVAWTFDNQESTEDSVIELTPGWHTVGAVVTYSNSTKDVLELEIEVK